MTILEIIIIILSAVGGSAVLFGAVAWIVKSIINHVLARDIEKFKLNLQNESQQELLRLQSSLQLHEFEYQVRFSQLHERLAVATIEVYNKLQCLYAEVKGALASLTMDTRSVEELRNDLQKAASAFAEYYPRHKILFPKELTDRIDEFHSLLCEAIIKDRQSERSGQAHPEESRWEKLQAEVDQIVDEKLPTLFSSLELHFRKILGSVSPGNATESEQVASADRAEIPRPEN